MPPCTPLRRVLIAAALLATLLASCSGPPPSPHAALAPPPPRARAFPRPPSSPGSYSASSGSFRSPPPARTSLPEHGTVLTGIDVLEADGFAELQGRRIGLLTHPAGVDRNGVSTIEILRRAPGVRLVSLFAVEHGIYGEFSAGSSFGDYTDRRTGLPVHSLYNGRSHSPTRAQLAGLDTLVVDLQDIGSRSYTFVSAMKVAMEACFQNGVELVVLDRPNPLGGLKVSGPLLDPQLVSYGFGEFRVPYVHGLTMGELANLAWRAPGVLAIPEAERERGRLVVIRMRGWRRSMTWPDTGLTWHATSPYIRDFNAVLGYPMVGIGCDSRLGVFHHGIGLLYPFRGITCHGVRPEVVEAELHALRLPGLAYRPISVPDPRTGKPIVGTYIEITDWSAWQPADLNFYLMRLACKFSRQNPFAALTRTEAASVQGLTGSTAFFRDITLHGAQVNVEAYLRQWAAQDRIYQQASRRYWLYNQL